MLPALSVVVVDRSSRNAAAALLLIGYVRHYGWALVDPALRGVVSKGLAALAILCLLAWLLSCIRRSWIVVLAAAWFAMEEVQVAACSAAFAASPWPVLPGQPLCSSWLHFDIGAATIIAAAALAALIAWTREYSQ